ncbi:hypothetical protein [Calycomorphotria hydatis]|uniref:Uncharacterized protein n=1 Tax=Calycomorphotria hydatis TaxID=2528027 RepID=A0A517TCD2_9PLAN|nr:hypothetical protein [Calycomorphotria hydatis]QDT66010.1 hypothetical protein V22_32740 [Calycomorphotria hydatis]
MPVIRYAVGEVPLPTDPIIEFYKAGIDRTLLRENLKLTPEERLLRMTEFMQSMDAFRGIARRKPTEDGPSTSEIS